MMKLLKKYIIIKLMCAMCIARIASMIGCTSCSIASICLVYDITVIFVASGTVFTGKSGCYRNYLYGWSLGFVSGLAFFYTSVIWNSKGVPEHCQQFCHRRKE